MTIYPSWSPEYGLPLHRLYLLIMLKTEHFERTPKMKRKFDNKPKLYLLSAMCVGIFIIACAMVMKTPVFLGISRSVIRQVKILNAGGETAYVARTLANQAPVSQTPMTVETLIETSRLPLRQRYVALPREFPEGGGALTTLNGKLLLMSRTGTFYSYESGSFQKLNWGDLPSRLNEYILHSNTSLNSDLMRASYIAFDESRQRIFVGHNRYEDPKTNRLIVSSLDVDSQTLRKKGDWQTEFESDTVDSAYGSQAGGGRVAVHNGALYFSVGYSDTPTILDGKKIPGAQNPKSKFGKIFRKDLGTGQVEAMSMGHRNVQGLAFTRSGDLLSTEHGPQGGDEINLITKGANFGWPYRTYGTDYGSYTYKSGWVEPAGFVSEEPIYAFVPSIALSPIQVIEGFHPAWNGDILVGSLKAQSLFRMVFKSGRVVVSEPIWIGHRIRDIAQLPGDCIVLLTDDSLLVFLTVDVKRLQADAKNAGYNFEPKLTRCLVCHHFEQSTPSSLAPSLVRVVGRKMGSDSFERYSAALKSATGVWNKKILNEFIVNPQSVLPGTSMPNLGLSPSEAMEIVEILAK